MALILVTGASSGLGRETAVALAAQGHDVVGHVRSSGSRGAPEGLAEVLHADLARQDETLELAAQANGIGVFDAVIHNAGVLSGADVAAVNIVAPYLLSTAMTRPGRAVFLSSSMHRSGSSTPPTAAALLSGRIGYEDSKLQVTAFSMALAHWWPEVMVHAVDPGWVPTRMGGPHAPDSLEEGHRTQEWIATADAAEISPRTGGYWHHRRTRRPHPASLDTGYQDALLAALAEYTSRILPL